MKQLIVMVSTIILGIAIAVIVMSFSTQADRISESVNSNISDVLIQYDVSGDAE